MTLPPRSGIIGTPSRCWSADERSPRLKIGQSDMEEAPAATTHPRYHLSLSRHSLDRPKTREGDMDVVRSSNLAVERAINRAVFFTAWHVDRLCESQETDE